MHNSLQFLLDQRRPVFPMNPQTKRPACKHGVHDATLDPEKIRAWFTNPSLVPAVATGEPSGVVILDLDRQYGAAEWWQENRDRLPETETYRTKSGGLHLVFKYTPGITTTALGTIGTGVELRSTGASAIYWPYAGLQRLSNAPPASLPPWVLPPAHKRPERPPEPFRVADEASIGHLVRWAASAAPGERNKRLYWFACRLNDKITAGTIQAGYAASLIEQIGVHLGLPLAESRATAQSAIGGRP